MEDIMSDFFSLRDVGYTGPVDQDNRVRSARVKLTDDQAKALTQAVLALYRYLRPADGTSAPKYWLMVTDRKTHVSDVRWFSTRDQMIDALRVEGVMEKTSGSASTRSTRYAWGVVPPMEALEELPTPAVVSAWPDWFIGGPGRWIAERMPCAHGYNLTDSCPGCDARAEEAGQEPLGIVTSPTEAEKAMADIVARQDRALEQRAEKLENQIWLALNEARQQQKTNQQLFLNAIRDKGAVRAMQLHAKEAAKLDLAVRVWQLAVDAGRVDGWSVALERAHTYALRQLRDSATSKTSARITAALAGVNADAADELLSAIETVRKTNR